MPAPEPPSTTSGSWNPLLLPVVGLRWARATARGAARVAWDLPQVLGMLPRLIDRLDTLTAPDGALEQLDRLSHLPDFENALRRISERAGGPEGIGDLLGQIEQLIDEVAPPDGPGGPIPGLHELAVGATELPELTRNLGLAVAQIERLLAQVDGLVPAAERLAPAAEGLAPAAEALVPAAEALVPAAEALVPAAEGLAPVAARLGQAADDLVPAAAGLGDAAAKLTPAAAKLVTPAERLAPAAARLGIAADELTPAAKALGPEAKQLREVARELRAATAAIVETAEALRRTGDELGESFRPVVRLADRLPGSG